MDLATLTPEQIAILPAAEANRLEHQACYLPRSAGADRTRWLLGVRAGHLDDLVLAGDSQVAGVVGAARLAELPACGWEVRVVINSSGGRSAPLGRACTAPEALAVARAAGYDVGGVGPWLSKPEASWILKPGREGVGPQSAPPREDDCIRRAR